MENNGRWLVLRMSLATYLLLYSISCNIPEALDYKADIKINNVSIWTNKGIIPNQTILVKEGIIDKIVSNDQSIIYSSLKIIEGNGRLVTPGFINTHIHITDIFGDYERAPVLLSEDSLQLYESELKKTFLDFGTTTILDMGQPIQWLEFSSRWQNLPHNNVPHLINTGSALISKENRTPYISHFEINSEMEIQNLMDKYDTLHINSIKVYWRLREQELIKVISEAHTRNKQIYAHIDENVFSISKSIDLGIRNFEHLQSIGLDVFKYPIHFEDLLKRYKVPPPSTPNEYLAFRLLVFLYISEDPTLDYNLRLLIQKMAKFKCSLSTTIHILGSLINESEFITSIDRVGSSHLPLLPRYRGIQRQALKKAYIAALNYLKFAHNQGVLIRIGTDCRDSGNALLSELVMLSKAGFQFSEIMLFATENGAKALNSKLKIGKIDEGYEADLIIFDKNPSLDIKNIHSSKVIINNGIVVED